MEGGSTYWQSPQCGVWVRIPSMLKLISLHNRVLKVWPPECSSWQPARKSLAQYGTKAAGTPHGAAGVRRRAELPPCWSRWDPLQGFCASSMQLPDDRAGRKALPLSAQVWVGQGPGRPSANPEEGIHTCALRLPSPELNMQGRAVAQGPGDFAASTTSTGDLQLLVPGTMGMHQLTNTSSNPGT